MYKAASNSTAYKRTGIDMQMTNIKARVLCISERLFLVLCSMYLVYATWGTTTFTIRFPDTFEYYFTIILFVVVAFRVMCSYKEKLLWASLCVGIAYMFIWSNYFTVLALMTIGCVGIPYRRVIKAYIISVGGTVLVTAFAALSDCVINYVRTDGIHIKSSMGICYTTDYASIVLFVLLASWVLLDRKPILFSILAVVLTILNSWFIARSRTSMICGILLLMFSMVIFVSNTHSFKNRLVHSLNGFIDLALQLVFPVLAISCVVLTYAYSKSFPLTYMINRISSNRLQLTLDAFKNNPITLFGYNIQEAGYGSSNFPPLHYSFIDISYVKILLKYGVIAYVVFIMIWSLFTRRALKTNNRRLAFAVALMAVHSFSEHHLPELAYNIYIILPFSMLPAGEKRAQEDAIVRTQANSRNRIVKWSCVGVLSLLELCMMPALISWFRIIAVELSNQYLFVVHTLVFFALSIGTVWAVSDFISEYIQFRRAIKLPVVILCCFVSCVFVYNECTLIRQSNLRFKDTIVNDRAVLDKIIEGKSGNLYVNKLGALYHEINQKVDISIFDGDDIARLGEVTLLTSEDYNSAVLFNNGFLYTTVSDDHAIYTRDPTLIEYLEQKGFVFTSYCTHKEQLDFSDIAHIHDVSVDSTGKLPIGGGIGPKSFSTQLYFLQEGKQFDLYAGKYAVICDMEINPDPYEQDFEVCRLRVSAYGGAKTMRDISIYRSWFDDNGLFSNPITFITSSCPALDINLLASEEQPVYLKRLSWTPLPDYDTRRVYDQKHRVIAESYHDSQGDEIPVLDGYSTCKYTYNSQDLIETITHCNSKGNPINSRDGYARIEREYNANKLLAKESFYDINGKPVSLPYGYSMRRWEYDGFGNITTQVYCDDHGNPVMTKDGYAGYNCEYDSDHRLIAVSFFDQNEEPVDLIEGYASMAFEYYDDDNDNPADDLVEYIRYLDATGTITPNRLGAYSCRRQYNDAGEVIEEVYLDQDNKPMMTNEGYASVVYTYDCNNNIWLYRYCNENGNPTRTANGYAEIRCSYDKNGSIIKESYFDADSQPCQLGNGYAETNCVYDGYGNLVEQHFLGLTGDLLYECKGYHWITSPDFQASLRGIGRSDDFSHAHDDQVARPYALAPTYPHGTLPRY